MVPTLIADSSCVIDLHKATLLLPLFELPYTIVMPQTLLDDELISLTDNEKRELLDRGLQTRHLDAAGLVQAKWYFDRFPALTWNDCLALRMAEETEATASCGESQPTTPLRSTASSGHWTKWNAWLLSSQPDWAWRSTPCWTIRSSSCRNRNCASACTACAVN